MVRAAAYWVCLVNISVWYTTRGLERPRVDPEAKGHQGCVLCRVSMSKTYDFVCSKTIWWSAGCESNGSLKTTMFAVYRLPIEFDFQIFSKTLQSVLKIKLTPWFYAQTADIFVP